MANFTKKAIKETFVELLEEHPLSDITIKDIVEKCGINRNSFYYHYHDLPDLIEEIVKEDAEGIIKKYPSVKSIVECYDALIEFASQHKRAIIRQTLTDYYKCVCFGLVIEWLNKGMKEEYAQEFRKILVMRKDLAPEIAKGLQD